APPTPTTAPGGCRPFASGHRRSRNAPAVRAPRRARRGPAAAGPRTAISSPWCLKLGASEGRAAGRRRGAGPRRGDVARTRLLLLPLEEAADRQADGRQAGEEQAEGTVDLDAECLVAVDV